LITDADEINPKELRPTMERELSKTADPQATAQMNLFSDSKRVANQEGLFNFKITPT
jgi:hypothetical protein